MASRESAYRRGAALDADVREEQFLPVDGHAVRNADDAHAAAGSRRVQRLAHRLGGADAPSW
jgi:hypothetical protein